MDAMAASIAHEINQPLGAMVVNGNAGLRWLERATPDIDEARSAFTRIVNDGRRASEVITSIRAMFKKDIRGRARLGVNDIVREVLAMIDRDLRSQRVSVSLELREGLPQLLADRGQLQQVFLNLMVNALEAMRPVTGRARVLRIRSDIVPASSSVAVMVEDFWYRNRWKRQGPSLRAFLHNKIRRNGSGTNRLSVDHSGPRWEPSGICQQSLRDDLSCRFAER